MLQCKFTAEVSSQPSVELATNYIHLIIIRSRMSQPYPATTPSKIRRPVGSVGRVPDYRAGGRGFKPRPDQHSGSLNNRGESAAFVMTSANG